MLKQLLGFQLFTVGTNTIRQLRSVRPTIQISEERFRLTLHLKEFTLDEISVKAHPDYLLVEGKQEKDTESGLMIKHFTRKFKLPKGVNVKNIESKFSPDGVLTVTALRSTNDLETSDMVEVPISSEGIMRGRKIKESKVYPPSCQAYPKVKPKIPKETDPKSKK